MLCPTAASAQDIDDLLRARDAFLAGSYAQAVPSLLALMQLSVANPREAAIVSTARKYYAAYLYTQRREDEARALLEQMLRDDPDAHLDQTQFDPGFALLFDVVRGQMQAELELIRTQRIHAREESEARRVAREELLRRLATSERHAEEVPRALMWIPFGVGQFANGQTALGVVFLSLELALTATCIASYALHQEVYPVNGAFRGNFDDAVYARTLLVTNWTAAGALLLVGVGGIVQANLAWRPVLRTTTVPRPLPRELEGFRLTAGLSPDGTGPGATLRLTF